VRRAFFAAIVVTVAGIALLRSYGPAAQPGTATAQGAQLRIVLPMMSREVLPDPGIETLAITGTGATESTFMYRIRNVGGAAVDLSNFTLRAWFSADETLQPEADVAAGDTAFSVTLAPGAAIEASAVARAEAGAIAAYPYLVVTLTSDGGVPESSTANNTALARRPPLDLIVSPLITWEPPGEPNRAAISWNYRGQAYGIPDEGFRVEVPGFGTQEVPAGTRSIDVPFNAVTGERPCLARISALRTGAEPWPAVESNRLCE
jgi:hypothetical protein